jgi:Leucine Rich repeat
MSFSSICLDRLPKVILENIQDFLPMEKIAGDIHHLSSKCARLWPMRGNLDFSESLIHGSDLTNVLNAYQKEHTCRSLNFSYCANIKDGDLEQLKNIAHLEHLDLSGCKITDKAAQYLKEIPSLKHVDLKGCRKITDRAPFNALPFRVHFDADCRPIKSTLHVLPRKNPSASQKTGMCLIL